MGTIPGFVRVLATRMQKILGAKRSEAFFNQRRSIEWRAAKVGSIAAGHSSVCPQPGS